MLALLPSHRLSAGGEELATNAESDQSVSDDGSTTGNIGIGKFTGLPFHVSVSVRGGYDDNVLTAHSDQQGSAFVNTNFALTYNFGSPRMTIDLQTNGGITDYFDQPGGINYDFNPNINFSLTYKASPRLTISETTYAAYQNQPDFQSQRRADAQKRELLLFVEKVLRRLSMETALFHRHQLHDRDTSVRG